MTPIIIGTDAHGREITWDGTAYTTGDMRVTVPGGRDDKRALEIFNAHPPILEL